jgi:antitoxin HigA-1
MNTLRHPTRRHTHPGAILREDVLPALGITQTEFAERLGVSRLSVSELLHEKRALSPEMALRLSKFLDTTPESWLNMQTALSIWEARQLPDLLDSVKSMPKARASLRKGS